MKARHTITNKTREGFWILLLLISVNGTAQKIKLQSVSYNPEYGEQWPNENNCFFKGFTPLFSVDSSPKIWSFYLSTENGDYKVWETSERTSTWNFKVDDIPFRDIADKAIYRIENDSSLYWKGFVGISNTPNGKLLDRYPITLNLLPASPCISDIELLYEGYDWEHDYLINPKFRFLVTSKRMEKCLVGHTDPMLLPGDFFFFLYIIIYSEKEGDSISIEENEVIQWNEYLKIVAQNDFGSAVFGDTLCTTNYIKDEAILQRIKQMETSISDVKSDDDMICWDGHFLTFDQASQIRRIIIYDGDGKTNKTYTSQSSIDLSAMPSKMYLVACYLKNGKIITKKIIKK